MAATMETRDDTRDARMTTGLPTRPGEKIAEVAAGGSIAEVLAGAAGIVLGILGLAGVYPAYLLPIGIIVLGAALLFEGASIVNRYRRVIRLASVTGSDANGGMRIEMLGGIAAIVLGILALIQIAPLVLSSVAAIVFGGAILLGSSAMGRLSHLEGQYRGWDDATQEMARDTAQAASGLQVLVGIGTIVLGILAVIGIATEILCLVTLLCVGGAVVLSAAALGTRMLTFLNR